jgi:hypothetical protein
MIGPQMEVGTMYAPFQMVRLALYISSEAFIGRGLGRMSGTARSPMPFLAFLALRYIAVWKPCSTFVYCYRQVPKKGEKPERG